MKQSRTALKELTAAYRAVLRRGILCNAIALGLMAVSTPVMAGAPNTDGYAFVFGDLTIPSGLSIETMAFGGRRMSAPEHMNDGKYRNDFPNYSMLGQSLIVGDNNAEDPLYVGPVNLTLRQLTNEQFRYNYQAGADGETDIDLALAPTELVTPLERIGWNDTAAATKVAAVIGESNANYTAPGVVMFSHKDNDATNDGLLSLTKTNAVIDGATVTADRISVLNSSVTFAKQDTALLNTSSSFYSIVGSDGEGAYDGIRSDGITTLNADTMSFDASRLIVNPDAELKILAENSAVFTHGTGATVYGGVISNQGKTTIANGHFVDNTVGKDGAAIYNKGTLNLAAGNFENNNARWGGAIENIGGDIKAVGTVFDGNTASQTGGAIDLDGGSLDVSTNAQFKNNSANWGGAIYSSGHSVIKDTLFENNYASTSGGAISTNTDNVSTMELTNIEFRNNHAYYDGGAIANFSGLTISNSHFVGNTSDYDKDLGGNYVIPVTDDPIPVGGGAIALGAISSTSVGSITGTVFEQNKSGTNGGAIGTRLGANADNSAAKLDIAATFTGNEALLDGGAIFNTFYSDNGLGKGSGVTITGNFTNNNAHNNGGAIYNDGSVDKAGNNGGVMTVYDSVFSSNIATSHNGGAIYNSGVLYLAGNNSFSGNTAATNGGAIYNEGDLYLAGNNNFTGNTAAGKANDIYNFGALYVEGTTTLNGGTTGSGTLVVKDGATLNLGTASITQGQIDLQNGGTINATLDKDATSPLFNASYYTGQGTLKLAMAEIGTYHVFSGESFDIVSDMPWTITNSDRGVAFANSAVYNLTWNKGDVTAEKKSVEEIASGSDIAVESAAVVSNIIDSASNSSSKQMKDLSLKMQEKLAEGTPEAKAEVEHAAAAINPEKESVVQSVSSSVQNTVTNLASARMSSPMVGRSAGDIQLTSGGVWAQGIFNKSKQNNAFNGYTRGIAVGLDGTFNKDVTIGAGYSYAHSDITGSARDTEIDSSTVFVYGQYKPEQWYVNAVASYTMSDYSESGMAMGTHVTSDYDVNSYGLSLATGYDFASGITPELGLRYLHVNADEYTSSARVKTSLKDNDFMTAVLGTKYAFNVVADKYTTFVPQLNVAVKYDLLSDEHVANVTMPGIDTYSLEGKRLSRVGGEFGVGLGIRHKNIDFSVNYDIDVRNDYTSQTGMLKFRCNF